MGGLAYLLVVMSGDFEKSRLFIYYLVEDETTGRGFISAGLRCVFFALQYIVGDTPPN
jgi:hypothetical protein